AQPRANRKRQRALEASRCALGAHSLARSKQRAIFTPSRRGVSAYKSQGTTRGGRGIVEATEYTSTAMKQRFAIDTCIRLPYALLFVLSRFSPKPLYQMTDHVTTKKSQQNAGS